MSTHIVQIGKYKFICGLFWQSLSRPRELRKEATELAKKINFDMMVLRIDQDAAQAGYVNTQDGAKKGLFSLGAVVAKTIAIEGAYYDGRQQPAPNWLGAFRLPDDVWCYFAVRDGSFMPNGDFAGTREQVIERLQGDYGLGGWNVVIGEAELESYGFHKFNAKEILDMIPRKDNGQIRVQKWWGLVPVKKQFPLVPMGATVAVAAIAWAGAFFYQRYLNTLADEAQRSLAMERVRQELLQKQPLLAQADAPRPWAEKPTPASMVRACKQNIVPMHPGGWSLEEYVCTREQRTYFWKRGDSLVSRLLQSVPDAVVEISGEKATHAEAVSIAPGGDIPLVASRELIIRIVSRLQAIGIALKISAAPSAQPNATGKGNPNTNPAWQTFTFNLEAQGIPLESLAEILEEPGVRLDRIIYRNNVWSMEGSIYAE
ncbi:MAG TPA: type 4b pilus protein PilO2 [Noviherbaspirillum sp.]